MSPVLTEKDAAANLGLSQWKLASLRRAGIIVPSHNLNPHGLKPRPGYSETCLAGIRALLQWKPVEAEGASR